MKKIFKLSLLTFLATVLLSACGDFFEELPGVQLDLDGTFNNRQKTREFLNNVYTYIPDDVTGERYYGNTADRYGGIWGGASMEANWSWDWHNSHKWNLGETSAGSDYVTFWWKHYYAGISKASTFMKYVGANPELSEYEKTVWTAEARALRALYYFYLLRQYGPCVLHGEEPVALDTPASELLRPRNTVDECVNYIVQEFDAAAEILPAVYNGTNLGYIDRGQCKGFKAKVLLYAASPLFNGNKTFESVQNEDGTHLFPQTFEQSKWERARDAYKEFMDEFVPGTYDLHVVTTDGKKDPYESYRQITTGCYHDSKENISMKLVWHGDLNYAITPYHKHINVGEIRGGLGLAISQDIVDMFYTNKGLTIEADPDYKEYGFGVTPSSEYYGSAGNYNDPVVTTRNYFKANSNLTLKQWENREPRFYVCVTFNGSTWLNTKTTAGEVTTELHYNGNSGNAAAGHDAPYTGYGWRKTARASTESGRDNHFSCNLRLADMYLGYAETLSATNDFTGAMQYVNKVRSRAGVPEYGTGTDENGLTRISYPANREEVDKRIRRERLVELALEANHFFDVRRWMVADMAIGDGWIYPSYKKGGEGGEFHGLNYRYDPPEFFRKVVLQNRIFEKRHYFMPIPDAEVRRNPKMVQNFDWKAAED